VGIASIKAQEAAASLIVFTVCHKYLVRVWYVASDGCEKMRDTASIWKWSLLTKWNWPSD